MEPTGFESFGFNPILLSSLKKLGYQKPTLIQKATFPYLAQGKDLVIRASSGSGKTLAYLLPIFDHLISNKNVTALIITPNLRICEQIHNFASKLASFQRSNSNISNGIYEVFSEFPHSWKILITTPLRAFSYLSENHLLSNVLKYLIIDDFDLILQMELHDCINNILNIITGDTQRILSSQSLDVNCLSFKNIFPEGRKCIKISDNPTMEVCSKQFYFKTITVDEKFVSFFAMFKLRLMKGRVLVFVNSIQQGYKLLLFLRKLGIKAEFLNPRLPLKRRTKIAEGFNSKLYNFLIFLGSSQKCLESIDNSKVIDLIIHFDTPSSISEYFELISNVNLKTSIAFCTENELLTFLNMTGCDQNNFQCHPIRPYDLKMINDFKYRCVDILRSLTKKSITESMISDLKRQLPETHGNINLKKAA